ncbi:MAG: hypothetical protein ABIQ95_03495 [Bdellovibrionia bacterium]
MLTRNINIVLFGLSLLISGSTYAADLEQGLDAPNAHASIEMSNLAFVLGSEENAVGAPPIEGVRSWRQSRAWYQIKKWVSITVGVGIFGGIVIAVVQPFAIVQLFGAGGLFGDGDNSPGPLPFVPNGDAFSRGMYLSVWTDAAEDPILADKYNYILGDSRKEFHLIEFIKKYKIDSISLFNLPVLLDMPGMPEKLSQLIVATKNAGVKEVLAAGSKKADWVVYAGFQKNYPARFDGLITEVEFWNSQDSEKTSAYKAFLDLADDMRAHSIQTQGRPFKFAVYMGLLDSVPNVSQQEVAREIVSRVDRVILHCYEKNPQTSYQNCKDRMSTFLSEKESQAKDMELVPLVSTEGPEFSASNGRETFMGSWLQGNASFEKLESEFRNQIRQDTDPNKLSGIYYYEYMYTDYDLSHPKN